MEKENFAMDQSAMEGGSSVEFSAEDENMNTDDELSADYAHKDSTSEDDDEVESEDPGSTDDESDPTDEEDNSQRIGKAPPPRNNTGSIARTRFADEYKSTFTREMSIHAQNILPLLAHANCNYLSTYGIAPTLTELKQHAQSLIVLIRALTISTSSAFIDNKNLKKMKDAAAFHDGETYDFLNDLSIHYDGPKLNGLVTHHSLPLNAALNTVETVHIIPTQTACACAASKNGPMPGEKERAASSHN